MKHNLPSSRCCLPIQSRAVRRDIWRLVPVVPILAVFAVCVIFFIIFGVIWWQSSNLNASVPTVPPNWNNSASVARACVIARLTGMRPELLNILRIPNDRLWSVNPDDSDSDGDGLLDREELLFGTDSHNRDSDADRLWDSTELRLGLNPNAKNTFRDGIPDGQRDNDRDGFSNLEEQQRGHDPGSAASSPAGGTPSFADGSLQCNVPMKTKRPTLTHPGHRPRRRP